MIIYQDLDHYIHLYIAYSTQYRLESCSVLWYHGWREICDLKPGEIWCEMRLEYRRCVLVVFHSTKVYYLCSLYRSVHHDCLTSDSILSSVNPDLFSCFTQGSLPEQLAIIHLPPRECPKTWPDTRSIWSFQEEYMSAMLDDEICCRRDEGTHIWDEDSRRRRNWNNRDEAWVKIEIQSRLFQFLCPDLRLIS